MRTVRCRQTPSAIHNDGHEVLVEKAMPRFSYSARQCGLVPLVSSYRHRYAVKLRVRIFNLNCRCPQIVQCTSFSPRFRVNSMRWFVDVVLPGPQRSIETEKAIPSFEVLMMDGSPRDTSRFCQSLTSSLFFSPSKVQSCLHTFLPLQSTPFLLGAYGQSTQCSRGCVAPGHRLCVTEGCGQLLRSLTPR